MGWSGFETFSTLMGSRREQRRTDGVKSNVEQAPDEVQQGQTRNELQTECNVEDLSEAQILQEVEITL